MSNNQPTQPQPTVTGKVADIAINTPTHKANESLNLKPMLTVFDFETLTENIDGELETLFYILTLAVHHADFDELQAVAEIALKTVTAIRSELDETTSNLFAMRMGEKYCLNDLHKMAGGQGDHPSDPTGDTKPQGGKHG